MYIHCVLLVRTFTVFFLPYLPYSETEFACRSGVLQVRPDHATAIFAKLRQVRGGVGRESPLNNGCPVTGHPPSLHPPPDPADVHEGGVD